MPRKGATDDKREQPRRRRPAVTAEDRENQVINLAVELAERQLADGTATSQVMVHFLRLGTTKAKLELKKLEHETELLKAKTEAIESVKRIEQLYGEAIKAMRSYQGREPDEEPEDAEDV